MWDQDWHTIKEPACIVEGCSEAGHPALLQPMCTVMMPGCLFRTPMCCRVEKAGLQSTILAWDIINEPEWAIREANEKFQPAPKVPLAQMQRFVGKCAAAIHRKGALATVGSARTSWNWENAQTAQEEGKQWK